jgi:hypothetical protein
LLTATAWVASAATNIVTTADDNSAGSLRQAILNSLDGGVINLSTNLSGATILLTSGELLLDKNLAIDGSGLPGGIRIEANHTDRIFEVPFNTVVVLNSLTIADGVAASADGGGIFNRGDLTLDRCSVVANLAGRGGGAIYNSGTLTLNQCTFSGNTALWGGALSLRGGVAVADHCTFAFNESSGTDISGSGGGAIDNFNSADLTLIACILAQNSVLTTNGPELWMESGTLVATNCLLGDGKDSSLINGEDGNLVGTTVAPLNALLGALGYYGGPTPTLPPLPGSPALNAAAATAFTTDQRGFPRLIAPAPDIGAVEGVFNPAGPGMLTGPHRLAGGSFQFSFTNFSGMPFTVLASTNVTRPVTAWANLGTAVETPPGSGQFQFNDPQATNQPLRFYRVRTP